MPTSHGSLARTCTKISPFVVPGAIVPLFFFYCNGGHRDLHSFPTRRSSDLPVRRRSRVLRRLPGRRRSHRGHRDVPEDRKSTRLNSSHGYISYAVFCLKKKKRRREVPYVVPL